MTCITSGGSLNSPTQRSARSTARCPVRSWLMGITTPQRPEAQIIVLKANERAKMRQQVGRQPVGNAALQHRRLHDPRVASEEDGGQDLGYRLGPAANASGLLGSLSSQTGFTPSLSR